MLNSKPIMPYTRNKPISETKIKNISYAYVGKVNFFGKDYPNSSQ